MSEPPKHSWVWRSTEASRAAGQVSVLAVCETLICVAAYWALVLWLGVTFHHWVILIAAPLVLLRSDQSVAQGLAWFYAYYDKGAPFKPSPGKFISIIIISAALAGCAGLFFTTKWLVGANGWALFAMGTGIGLLALNIGFAAVIAVAGPRGAPAAAAVAVAVAVAVAAVAAAAGAGVVAAAGVVAGAGVTAGVGVAAGAGAGAIPPAAMLLIPGFAGGNWVRAMAVRVTATLRFLWPGLRQLPKNWRFLTCVSDMFQPPEIVPGHEATTLSKEMLFSSRKSDGKRYTAAEFVFRFTMSFILYTPTLLWRWSIKSTAWFYLPLLLVRRGWLRLQGEELRIWAQSYSSKAWNWIWMGFGWLYLAALAVGLFSFEKWLNLRAAVTEAGAPMPGLGFLMALEWAEILKQPWLWFYIPSYALTLIIFFALDGIAKDILVGGAAPDTRSARMGWLMWAENARAVLTNIGLGLALLYFLRAVGAGEQVANFFLLIF